MHKKSYVNSLISSDRYRSLCITICISILLHIILLIKITLPFYQTSHAQYKPIEIYISKPPDTKTSSHHEYTDGNFPLNKFIPKVSEHSLVAKPPASNKPDTDKIFKDSSEQLPSTQISNSQIQEKLDENQTLTSTASDQLIPSSDVHITFTLISINDGKNLGEGEQHFTFDGINTYRLNIKNTPNNMNALANNINSENEWSYDVDGRVSGDRLRASFFDVKGALGEQLLFLSRETNNGSVVSEKPTGGTMPDGILDRQSMIYQFMFKPPKNYETKLLLSDGAKNSTYKERIVATELVNSDYFGKIEVLHMLMSNIDNNEIIELWLAPTLKYLPIKVRYISAEGDITDLLVSKLSLN